MKQLLYLFLILYSAISYGQKMVSNGKNFNNSPFAGIELKCKKTKYNFEITPTSIISVGKCGDQILEKKIGLKENMLISALEFYYDNNSKLFYYPINLEKFNLKYFNEYINGKKKSVKIYTTIYKIEEKPFIIINKIKYLK